MTTENLPSLPPTPAEATDVRAPALGLATGSASEIIIAELTGKPIRKLNRERMLQTGDNLCNKFGQQLWTVEAFHPKGVRVTQWPQGGVADYTWESLYGFYERVPPGDPSLQNTASEPRPLGKNSETP